jgi:hypothetical protein
VNRIKRRTVGTYEFTATAEDENGHAQHISAPATVTIRDGAGTVVVTDTPTIHAGKLKYVANAALMPRLDTYTITWTGVVDTESQSWVTQVELVGGYLFEISDLRGYDRAFQDTNKFPVETLRQVRAWVEDVIEGPQAADVAFVPRGRRVSIDGHSRYENRAWGLDVPDYLVRSVYSASVDGVAFTNSQLLALICDDDTIWRPDTFWKEGIKNVSLHYEFGYDAAPGAITRAALLLAREYLVKSDLPSRATATSIGDQYFRLTIAGRDGTTGLPDVDAAIAQFGRKSYVVG